MVKLQSHGINKTVSLVEEKKLTKRDVVSIIDAPITTMYRILLQKLAKAGLDWYKPLQCELAKEAGTALEEMVLIEELTPPPQYEASWRERSP